MPGLRCSNGSVLARMGVQQGVRRAVHMESFRRNEIPVSCQLESPKCSVETPPKSFEDKKSLFRHGGDNSPNIENCSRKGRPLPQVPDENADGSSWHIERIASTESGMTTRKRLREISNIKDPLSISFDLNKNDAARNLHDHIQTPNGQFAMKVHSNHVVHQLSARGDASARSPLCSNSHTSNPETIHAKNASPFEDEWSEEQKRGLAQFIMMQSKSTCNLPSTMIDAHSITANSTLAKNVTAKVEYTLGVPSTKSLPVLSIGYGEAGGITQKQSINNKIHNSDLSPRYMVPVHQSRTETEPSRMPKRNQQLQQGPARTPLKTQHHHVHHQFTQEMHVDELWDKNKPSGNHGHDDFQAGRHRAASHPLSMQELPDAPYLRNHMVEHLGPEQYNPHTNRTSTQTAPQDIKQPTSFEQRGRQEMLATPLRRAPSDVTGVPSTSPLPAFSPVGIASQPRHRRQMGLRQRRGVVPADGRGRALTRSQLAARMHSPKADLGQRRLLSSAVHQRTGASDLDPVSGVVTPWAQAIRSPPQSRWY